METMTMERTEPILNECWETDPVATWNTSVPFGDRIAQGAEYRERIIIAWNRESPGAINKLGVLQQAWPQLFGRPLAYITADKDGNNRKVVYGYLAALTDIDDHSLWMTPLGHRELYKVDVSQLVEVADLVPVDAETK